MENFLFIAAGDELIDLIVWLVVLFFWAMGGLLKKFGNKDNGDSKPQIPGDLKSLFETIQQHAEKPEPVRVESKPQRTAKPAQRAAPAQSIEAAAENMSKAMQSSGLERAGRDFEKRQMRFSQLIETTTAAMSRASKNTKPDSDVDDIYAWSEAGDASKPQLKRSDYYLRGLDGGMKGLAFTQPLRLKQQHISMTHTSPLPRELKPELNDRKALKKALILRAALESPVALRSNPSSDCAGFNA